MQDRLLQLSQRHDTERIQQPVSQHDDDVSYAGHMNLQQLTTVLYQTKQATTMKKSLKGDANTARWL